MLLICFLQGTYRTYQIVKLLCPGLFRHQTHLEKDTPHISRVEVPQDKGVQHRMFIHGKEFLDVVVNFTLYPGIDIKWTSLRQRLVLASIASPFAIIDTGTWSDHVVLGMP